jgi:large subunit ribosomal protein L25
MEKMEKAVLKAEVRQVIGKQVNALRRDGKLPAVLYGRHIDPTPIVLDAHDATLTLAHLSSSSLVSIELNGKEYPALVREKQRDYIKGNLLHVDFMAVSLTEKIRAKVSIELLGASPAVKDFNAVLVTGLDQLEIECLPGDLPERVSVDISALAEIGDGLYVRDVPISEKVQVLDDPEELVVVATAAKEEEIVEEEEVVEVEEEAEEPEVIERGKREEEGEEGEAGEKAEE